MKNVPRDLGQDDHEVKINYVNSSKKDKLQNQLEEAKKEQRVDNFPDNRAYEKRRDTDDLEDLSIGIEDIDKAIKYQFEERFNMEISQNGQNVRVPVIWNSPDDWAWARGLDGRVTTLQDRILFPLLIIERGSISRDATLDGQNTRFNLTPEAGVYLDSRNEDPKNKFDDFKRQTDRTPVKKQYVVQVPKYLEIQYNIKMFTEKIHQMNRLVERIMNFSHEYWGNPNELSFRTKVENIDPQVENTDQDSRYVRAEFSITVNGYIIPKDMIYEATTKKIHTVSKVVFSNNTFPTVEEFKNRDNR